MWKHFFYFSKTERWAVVILLIIIVLALFYIHFLPFLSTGKEEKLNADDISDYFDFMNLLEETKYSKKENEFSGFSSANPSKKERFLFDPNLADSATFIHLGLKPYQARNILNYRRKGGRFKSASDFSKIYGLDKQLYEELVPYIAISSEKGGSDSKEKALHTNAAVAFPDVNQPNDKNQEKYAQGTVLELNTADTTQLKQIPGIGPAFAKRIVNYREKLGGFYSVHQLKEVYGVTPEMYGRLETWFRADGGNIRKICINKLGIEQLREHPYINYKQAKAFYEIRKNKGKLESLSEVTLLEEFSEEDIKRLSYYVDFR